MILLLDLDLNATINKNGKLQDKEKQENKEKKPKYNTMKIPLLLPFYRLLST
jgi:hypothetical protein